MPRERRNARNTGLRPMTSPTSDASRSQPVGGFPGPATEDEFADEYALGGESAWPFLVLPIPDAEGPGD